MLLAYIWPGLGHGFSSFPSILDRGYSPVMVVSEHNISEWQIDSTAATTQQSIVHYCKQMGRYFERYGWEKDPCNTVGWKADFISHSGHPLLYAVFGDGPSTTLLLSGVHPDEMTPLPMGFRFADYLNKHPGKIPKGTRIVIAPVVNPDGFMRNKPSRTNSRGVDPNRNFLTLDWYERAKELWIKRAKRSLRHFPGYFPNSEIETFFQMQLVEQFDPDKIFSVHSPLGFLDYDGPGDQSRNSKSEAEVQAGRLVHAIAKRSLNYRVLDYSFYPGSLGNYAGNERHIPTVTLELETTDPTKVDAYWQQFLPGLLHCVEFPLDRSKMAARDSATSFSLLYAQ